PSLGGLPAWGCGSVAPEGWPVVTVVGGPSSQMRLMASGPSMRLDPVVGQARGTVEPGAVASVEAPSQWADMHFTGWVLKQGDALRGAVPSPAVSLGTITGDVTLEAGYPREQVITFRIVGTGGGRVG